MNKNLSNLKNRNKKSEENKQETSETCVAEVLRHQNTCNESIRRKREAGKYK